MLCQLAVQTLRKALSLPLKSFVQDAEQLLTSSAVIYLQIDRYVYNFSNGELY